MGECVFSESLRRALLLNSQNSTLPGKFFNSGPDVAIPRFSYVRHRVRPGSGKGRETDVPGAAGPEQWVCQSKWVTVIPKLP